VSEWYENNPFVPVQESSGFSASISAEHTEQEVMGFLLVGQVKQEFFKVTCPCGVTDTYPLNEFPEVDTHQSCGRPNHWFVKYMESL
jgi:NAD(P)H-dependent FMN reductase